MRWVKLIALISALGLLLCGCQDTGEVENQAYVLVLALDTAEDGALELTVRVPGIGKSDAKGKEGDAGGSPYLSFSVSAPYWSRALDELQWATPRRVNLSHIEMIVVSQALASQPSFPDLMNAIADTPHLYSNARFVICAGSARDFLEAGETVIGTRLSSEIHTMLTQYARQGFIPDVCLADACYCANGIYGDPIAIWGGLEETPSDDEADAVLKSPMRQRFSGTALFRGGRFVRGLSRRDTRLLHLIRGQCKTFPCAWQGGVVELSVQSAALEARFAGDDVALLLRLRLRAPEGFSESEALSQEAAIRTDITRLVGDCQRLGIDPFGFAESAAAHFATVPQWTAFDWKSRYIRAPLTVDLTIST